MTLAPVAPDAATASGSRWWPIPAESADPRRVRALFFVVALADLALFGAAGALILAIADRDTTYDLVLLGAAAAAVALMSAHSLSLRRALRSAIDEQRRLTRSRLALERVLAAEDLRIVQQPILRTVDRRLVGVEALARFGDLDGSSPQEWFAVAVETGQAEALELLAVRVALRSARALPDDVYLAINVSPSTFVSAGLRQLVAAAELPPDRLVLELTEHVAVEDYAPLIAARERFRAAGVRVAVDDAGAGFASFRHVLALAPDIVKLDRSFISGIDGDPGSSALVAAVAGFACNAGITVVGEGVETAGELDHLTALGVHEVQGRYVDGIGAARAAAG